MAFEQDNTAEDRSQQNATSVPMPANNPNYVPSTTPITQGVPGGTASNQNPIHTNVTRDPASTPGYFRLVLPLLAGRYLARGGLFSMREFEIDWPSFLKKAKSSIEDSIRKYGKEPTQENHSAAMDELRTVGYRKSKAATKLDEFRQNYENTKHLTLEDTANIGQINGLRDNEDLITKARGRAVTRIYEGAYDTALGVASTYVTLNYLVRVKTDIKNAFAETVAFEKQKDPKDVTWSDLTKSDNLIVQSTIKNFKKKNAVRLAGDLLFFGKPISYLSKKLIPLRSILFGEMAIGMKGLQLYMEVSSKETTFFEDLIQMIDKKFNPIKGIGDPISTSDVIDMYQKFALQNTPKAAFTDATIAQNKDGIDWEKSNKIFAHITDLMNATYKYKHSVENNDVEMPPADFALPKFLYLLGHKLINPYKPEETLAFVDVANRYGIDAVKQVSNGLQHGASLEDMLKKYPVDLSLIKAEAKPVQANNAAMPVFFPANTDSMPQAANAPMMKISGVAVEVEKMATEKGASLTQG